jgi:hypothetical protein
MTGGICIGMNVETLSDLYSEREKLEKKIVELESILSGDGIRCKNCGEFVPIPKKSLAYITKHAANGYCYKCEVNIAKSHNKDRIMNLLGHAVYILDVDPWTDDGDSLRSITFFNERNQYWRINIHKEGKIENLKNLTNKEACR